MAVVRRSLVLAVLLIVIAGMVAAPVSAAVPVYHRDAIMDAVNAADPANATRVMEALDAIGDFPRYRSPAIVPDSARSPPAPGEPSVMAIVSPSGSIQAAIDATPDGGTVYLNPGTYHEHDIVIAKNIRIQANPSTGGSRSNTVIDGQELGRIFEITGPFTVTIDNLALQNGWITTTGSEMAAGGAILAAPGSSLTITSSSFTGCTATGSESAAGGAIFSEGTLAITSSVFSGCTATAGSGATLNIAMGGAVFSMGGPLTISSSSFDTCSASADGFIAEAAGGAVRAGGMGTTTISSTVFSACSATAITPAGLGGIVMGGAVAADSGSFSLTSSSFTSCSGSAYGSLIAMGEGGALETNSETSSIRSSSFTGCTVHAESGNMGETYGGAFFSQNLATSVTSTTFSGCSVTVLAPNVEWAEGGAFASASTETSVLSATFAGNSVSASGSAATGNADGGAVAILNSPATIHFSRFLHNTAGTSGPAVASSASTTTDATNNWWGSNSDPAPLVSGPVTTDPWLVLGITANPFPATMADTSAIRASLVSNSAGTSTAGGGISVPDNIMTAFAVVSGGGGVSPGTAGTANGIAATTFIPNNYGSVNISARIDDQTVYLSLPVSLPPAPSSTLDTSGNEGGFPSGTIAPSPTGEGTVTPMTVTVNIGGDSKAWQAVVTGTKLSDLIVTGTVQGGAGDNRTAPPGTVFQYISLAPARYTTITHAVIFFTVPQAWLDGNHIAPKSIVLYHLTTNGIWEALPTTVTQTKDGTVYFSAESTGFSLFAIAGTPAAATPAITTVATFGSVVEEGATTRAIATKAPVITQTTAPPAPTPQPAAPSPLLNIVLVIAAIGVLAGGGFLARRWWIRRQNPALFEEY